MLNSGLKRNFGKNLGDKIGIPSTHNFLCWSFATVGRSYVKNVQCLVGNCDSLPRVLFTRE